MAKLKGPLFSLGASGQLAKTLVFFNWKGLNVVRQHVTPANPNTALQQTQRGYLAAAVAAVHAAQALAANALDQADLMAYAALASTLGRPMTWFNMVCKLWTDCKVLSDVPVVYTDGTVSDPTNDSIDLIMYINEETGSQLAAGKFYFGSTPTSLVHPVVASVVAGTTVALTASDCSAFLTAGNKYYFQFRPDAADPCEGADSGVYNFVAT